MKYSELIHQLEYWKRIFDENDPEIVINVNAHSYEIDSVQPVKGRENDKALGILFK